MFYHIFFFCVVSFFFFLSRIFIITCPCTIVLDIFANLLNKIMDFVYILNHFHIYVWTICTYVVSIYSLNISLFFIMPIACECVRYRYRSWDGVGAHSITQDITVTFMEKRNFGYLYFLLNKLCNQYRYFVVVFFFFSFWVFLVMVFMNNFCFL